MIHYWIRNKVNAFKGIKFSIIGYLSKVRVKSYWEKREEFCLLIRFLGGSVSKLLDDTTNYLIKG